ncbi:neutral/alkaline ceramidase [Rhodococcus sp. NPDC058521]|uniref:neutral/alkaline ceramidase n=1 Tax=Rhodococcus sp. NPDC058521 TaxID=3346536 RepID=UPI003666E132
MARINRRSMLAGVAAAPALAAVAGRAAQADPARAVSPKRNDPAGSSLHVGVGISDVTGPVAEVGMMGYSSFEQRTEGLHQRMRARAYVFAEGGSRVVYVVVDNCMIFQSVHDGVIARLAQQYGDLYTERNVMLTAVHSHAACGGASHNYAYNLAVMGFEKLVYDAEVDGIVEAISAAHDDLAPGSVDYGRGELSNASVNRSRVAFDRNPDEDKSYYPLGIDTSMRVMRIKQGGEDVGAINWFPTHCASLTNENHLVSGDNKGAAAYFWERADKGVDYLADGKPKFVAAFPQTNSGDMSPNLDLEPGHGPTDDEFENARIIGQRQVNAAQKAWSAASEKVTGSVDARVMYLDMAAQTVDGKYTPDGKPARTSPACIGAAMSAGSTEDGPAIPIFPEGTTNPLVDALGGMDAPIPQWLRDAQAPKLVLIAVGLVPPVGTWVPNILKIQILEIGQFYVVGGPAEFTIVSGLRIRRTVAAELDVPLENVIFQGYANSYSSYCTTPQEYDAQQYEGGSTMFGRYTLPAYQQGFAALAATLKSGSAADRGPAPVDNSGLQPAFNPGVDLDVPGADRKFGDVLTQPVAVTAGAQAVAEFVTGHPKNDLRRRSTYLEVQRRQGKNWVRHADDSDWSTKFHWKRTEPNQSTARITWDVPEGTPAGRYRIQHFGAGKDAGGTITTFTGTSAEFTVS